MGVTRLWAPEGPCPAGPALPAFRGTRDAGASSARPLARRAPPTSQGTKHPQGGRSLRSVCVPHGPQLYSVILKQSLKLGAGLCLTHNRDYSLPKHKYTKSTHKTTVRYGFNTPAE